MSAHLPRTALLGVGSMSGAVLDGLLAVGVPADRFAITNRSEASAGAFRDRGLDAVAVETDPEANRRAVRGAAIVVLGVKPFMVTDLLREIADAEIGRAHV